MSINVYILAAENSPALLGILRADPALAARQDEHGYSLVHAAASYGHLSLLRTLVREFNVPVDIRDEDGETALFFAETVDAARALVEELGLDPDKKNHEGVTAQEKIQEEDDFPEVAEYLRNRTATATASSSNGVVNGLVNGHGEAGSVNGVAVPELPSAPEGLQVRVGTMSEEDVAGQEMNPELRRLVEQLAARGDLETPEGQEELRRMIQEAVAERGLSEERNVRPRQD